MLVCRPSCFSGVVSGCLGVAKCFLRQSFGQQSGLIGGERGDGPGVVGGRLGDRAIGVSVGFSRPPAGVGCGQRRVAGGVSGAVDKWCCMPPQPWADTLSLRFL